MMTGVFINAFLMSSSIGMFFNLINISLFCGFFTAKNGKGILYNFLITLAILLSIIILNQGSFDIYFKIVEFFMKNILPQHLTKFINSVKGFNNLKEMELIQHGLNFIEKSLFEP